MGFGHTVSCDCEWSFVFFVFSASGSHSTTSKQFVIIFFLNCRDTVHLGKHNKTIQTLWEKI